MSCYFPHNHQNHDLDNINANSINKAVDIKCKSELDFCEREVQMLKNQIIEKDLIISKLNYQINKIKQDNIKMIDERDSQFLEIKDLKENYEKCLNEIIDKTEKLGEIRQKNLNLENENFQLKTENNQMSYRLNEFAINYQKLKDAYKELKSDSNKLNECFINLNKENETLKSELLQERNSVKSNYLSNKRLIIPKNILESNFQINSTSFEKNSSTKNNQDPEKVFSICEDVDQRNIISYKENTKGNSYNSTNFNICEDHIETLIPSNNFNGLENKRFRNHLEFKDNQTNSNLKSVENNIKNKSSNSVSSIKEKVKNDLFNKKNKISCGSFNNLNAQHISGMPLFSTPEMSSLLKRSFSIENFLVKLDKDSEKENYFEIGISSLHKNNPQKNKNEQIFINNKILKESVNIKENRMTEKSQTLDKKSFQRINESKSISPFKTQLHIQKFTKPPNIKDDIKKSKQKRNQIFIKHEKSNIEIIDNQKEQKIKKELANKNIKNIEKPFKQTANSLSGGVRLFSVNSSSTNIIDNSKNGELSIFEKFKIESTKENDTTHNSNNSRSYRKDKETNISNINLNKNNLKITVDNLKKMNDLEGIIVSLESTVNLEPITNNKNNQESKISCNDENEAIKDKNIMINPSNKPETYKRKSLDFSVKDCNHEIKLELPANCKNSLETDFKKFENYIINNGMENPIGDCLKSNVSNFNDLTHQAEKALQTCKSNEDIKYKSESTVMNKNNISLINKTSENITENITEAKNLFLDISNIDKKKKDERYHFNSNHNNWYNDKKISELFDINFNTNKISNKYTGKEIHKNDLKIVNSNVSDNEDDENNLNIYSNLNLSALNKVNDELEFKHSKILNKQIFNFAKSLEFNHESPKIQKKHLYSSIENTDIFVVDINENLKSNYLHDTKVLNYKSNNLDYDNHISNQPNPLIHYLDYNSNFPKSQNKSDNNNNIGNNGSRPITSILSNKVQHINLIKTKENTGIENKENINLNGIKTEIFHYLNKSSANDNLQKAAVSWSEKENQMSSKRKKRDKFPQSKCNFNKEINFLGITQEKIMKYHNKNKINVKTRFSNSPKKSKTPEIFNINEIDFTSLKNNDKIKQFSKEKEKILQELNNLNQCHLNKKQIIKKKQMELNLNELNKVLNGVVDVLDQSKK